MVLRPLRPVTLENKEFDTIQSKFQGQTEEDQLSSYQKVNEDLFGWLYFAPYEVLESLKYNEDEWYKLAFKHFYEGVNFRELLVKNDTRYGHSRYLRDPSEKQYSWDDPLTPRLKQEKFMTAQFCWWKTEIKRRYPQVFQTMQERFSDGLGGKIWFVGGGELKDYIPRRFLTRRHMWHLDAGQHVEGVFTWKQLQATYGNVFDSLTCEKWYTLWDCNMQILHSNKQKFQLSIPKIKWSNLTPTYDNTNAIWSNIKDEINQQIKKKIDADFPDINRV